MSCFGLGEEHFGIVYVRDKLIIQYILEVQLAAQNKAVIGKSPSSHILIQSDATR
jgi:hypothetical protein